MEIRLIMEELSNGRVLEHYCLRPDRHNRLLCPFHPDKTPSLQIYPRTNTFCCFSSKCAAGTEDAIQFIQLIESLSTSGGNCSKHEDLLKAATLVGGHAALTIQPPQHTAKLFMDADIMAREAVLTKYFGYYKAGLPKSKKAIA